MLLKTMLLGVISHTLAAPVSCPRQTTLSASQIQAIAPATASCDGADFPSECADANAAAGAIAASFSKYSITSKGEQAALLALMLYESGNFKYNIHHFPSPNPGQGTRNMQSYNYNLQYAKSLFDAQKVAAAEAQGPDAVLQLVLGDNESFGSAAWFLSSQCSAEIRQGLASGSAEGWTAYLTQCVGTTDTADRDTVWKAALQAMQG